MSLSNAVPLFHAWAGSDRPDRSAARPPRPVARTRPDRSVPVRRRGTGLVRARPEDPRPRPGAPGGVAVGIRLPAWTAEPALAA